MPSPDPAIEWRDILLGYSKLTSEDLDRLIADCMEEGAYHDFKSGLALATPKKAAATLRRYVSGFANADGGFFVLGVTNDRPHKIDGCTPPGGSTLAEWATDSLNPIAASLAPPARIHTVRYTGSAAASPGGGPTDVLVVSIARGAALVPVTEDGRAVYYLRIGDETIAPPDYLITDLLLGRRTRPVLTAHDPQLRISVRPSRSTDGNWDLHRFTIRWSIDNESFALASEIRAGAVAWVPTAGGDVSPTPRFMRNWIEASRPPDQNPYDGTWKPEWVLAHLHGTSEQDPSRPLHPFHTVRMELQFQLPLFSDFSTTPGVIVPEHVTDDAKASWHRGARRGAVSVSLALYVLSANGEPWWSELRFDYSRPRVTRPSPGEPPDLVRSHPCVLEGRSHVPPLVRWDFVPEPKG